MDLVDVTFVARKAAGQLVSGAQQMTDYIVFASGTRGSDNKGILLCIVKV